jgi:hypothetical protein
MDNEGNFVSGWREVMRRKTNTSERISVVYE